MNNYKEAIEEVKDKLIIKHRQLGQKATGKWEQSLSTEVKENSLIIYGLDYAKFLVEGRPPSNKRPPISPLVDWVEAKFKVRGKQAVGIAFAVANKIQKEGTTWHKKGGSDLLEFLESAEIKNFIEKEISETKLIELKLAFNRQLQTLQS